MDPVAPGERSTAIDGAVLCGGASRRMGHDKAFIVVDGRPMYRRVIDALDGAGALTVTVVGGDTARFGDDQSVTPDRWPGEGPLGGIITALHGPGHSPAVAVVSCDLIRPDAGAIEALVAARTAVDGDVAVAVADGRDQWAHAVWHRRVADHLESRFSAGDRAIHAAVDGLSVVRVPMPAQATADADRPQDLP